MIDRNKITLEWIEGASKKNRNADKILVEKVIRALLLLEGLAKQKLPFVFKGGTALMLLLNSTRRLSIDIDIVIPEGKTNIEIILDEVAVEQGFLRKELQHRNTSLKIKKEHYKFFYNPIHTSNRDEDFVLLDILYENVNYKTIESLPIQSHFLPQVDEPLKVSTPSIADILGDKLTAFAPNTTGIPYFKNNDRMSMEIIKQLYDIGCLFDRVISMELVKTTFEKFATTELNYRDKHSLNIQDVIEDIYQTSLCIATRGNDGKGNFDELLQGIQRVRGFIFSESFHLDTAITLASKAAYLASLIKYGKDQVDRFDNPNQMKEWIIKEPMNTRLNRLKKSNPEAFFYWYKISQISLFS